MMELKRIYELLNIERECIMRGSQCNRDCANCDLVQDESELILMYNILITMIGSLMPQWRTLEINKDASEGDN